MSPRALREHLTRSLALAFTLACLAAPRAALARTPRPYDAPRSEGTPPAVPPPPPEYLTHEADGIRIAYQPSTRERVRPLFDRVAAIRAELSAQLGRPLLGAVEIRVAAAPAEMHRLVPGEQLPSYITAIAFRDARLVVMSAASPVSFDPPDLEGWLRHELAHLALDEALADKDVPRWFHEGFAAQFSGEGAALRAETLCRAALGHRLLGLAEVEAGFPQSGAPFASLAYAQAADFARFLAEGKNRERFADLIGRVRGGEPFQAAIGAAYGGADLGRVELAWRKEMARRYSFLPVLGGALALWIVVAIAVLVRRARRRRALLAEQEEAEIERRLGGPASVRAARLSASRVKRGLDDDEQGPIPPEPEVPKVEHEGRWHTLH